MAFRCAKFLRAIFRRNAAQIADATPRAAPQHHFNAWLVGALSPPFVTRDGAQLLRRRSSAATPTVSPHEFHDLSVGARILAEGGGGAACGLVLPLIFTPMELVKVRRQVMRDDAATSWELARAAWREGGVAALYTGHRFTVARSTLGNASLFGAFEAWKALLRSPFWPGGDVGAWRASVLAGVLSGWTTQLVTFPLDAAKSRAQVAGAAQLDPSRARAPRLPARLRRDHDRAHERFSVVGDRRFSVFVVTIA